MATKRSFDEIWRNIAEIKWELEHELYMEKQHTIFIMQSPYHWTYPTFLPLTRKVKGEEELGFLFHEPAAMVKLMPTVYLGCIFDLTMARERLGALLTREKVMEMTCINYPTFAAIYAAGWEIDN